MNNKELLSTHNIQHISRWDVTDHIQIGSALVSLIIQIAKIPKDLDGTINLSKLDETNFPSLNAFKHSYIFMNGKSHGIISFDPDLLELCNPISSKDNQTNPFLLNKYLPMVCPPVPWQSLENGGYLSLPTCLVRAMSYDHETELRLASDNGKLHDLYEGLNAIGRVPWRINEPILNHMVNVWNTGLDLGKIPGEPGKEVPGKTKPKEFETWSNAEKRKWFVETKKQRQLYFDLKGLRATENYRLEIARAVNDSLIF